MKRRGKRLTSNVSGFHDDDLHRMFLLWYDMDISFELKHEFIAFCTKNIFQIPKIV